MVIIIEIYRNIKSILVYLWFGECAEYGKYSFLAIKFDFYGWKTRVVWEPDLRIYQMLGAC
jgi:hypothetical protein